MIRKTLCILAILLMFAVSVLCISRYRAEQDLDKCRRMLAKQELDASFRYLRKSIEANPYCLFYRNMSSRILLQLAINSRSLDLLRQAMVEAETIHSMYPESYDSYLVMAQINHLMGDYEKARKYYKLAIEKHPLKPDIKKKLESIL